MDPLVGVLVLGAYGLMVGAVAFLFIAYERRKKRKQNTPEPGGGQAHA
jgi:hypothetical protein